MTALEKLAEERDEQKNARIDRILAAAFKLFSSAGIEPVAMTDIAKKAEIGVASLYRYFSTKDEIAIRTAIWAWEKQISEIYTSINTDEYKNGNGLFRLSIIFSLFKKLYMSQPEFLRFIYFFDSYAVNSGIKQERMIEYENVIGKVQMIVADAIKLGLKDNSINKKYIDKTENLYFTLMHSFFSTAQKLTLSENLLAMNEKSKGSDQLDLLSELLLNGVKAWKNLFTY